MTRWSPARPSPRALTVDFPSETETRARRRARVRGAVRADGRGYYFFCVRRGRSFVRRGRNARAVVRIARRHVVVRCAQRGVREHGRRGRGSPERVRRVRGRGVGRAHCVRVRARARADIHGEVSPANAQDVWVRSERETRVRRWRGEGKVRRSVRMDRARARGER